MVVKRSAFEVPLYSRSRVDASARVLLKEYITADRRRDAEVVVANWRSAHAFPLNTITMDLRAKTKRINAASPVVQRLKRTRSIMAKLETEGSMRLTQMQDIGGCRVVLDSLGEVEALRDAYSRSQAEHDFVEEYDYIACPKLSGYRGVHLVFKYKSKSKPEYNGLLFEIQIRTELQHAWATAVETVGAVLGQALKASQGESEWLYFFKLAAAAFAQLEDTSAVPEIGVDARDLCQVITTQMRELDVEEKLRRYRQAMRAVEGIPVRRAVYYLLVLLPEEPKLEVYAYRQGQLEQAYADYLDIEMKLPKGQKSGQLQLFPELNDYAGAQAVLVGAEDMRSIKRAYPNYYLDTAIFVRGLHRFLEECG